MNDTSAVQGIDTESVTSWFVDELGATAPLTFGLIAGGRSNLTYRVLDAAGGDYVLRRPPLGMVLATAHDMAREHRIITALADTDVPVAPALALVTDDEVNGAPFYVMDFLDGLILREADDAEALDRDQRRRAGLSIAETLAKIHAVDPDAVGLGDLGRKDGYIERQLKRWNGQFEKSAERDLPSVTEAFARLSASIPEQGPAAIVHGDYRLDNTMLTPDGDVMAVLDWEICTLGDPLADLGLLMVYWGRPGDELSALPTSATAADGFPERDEMVAAYEAAGGRPVENLGFYTAFGYWKLACILEGVYARYKAGAMGDDVEAADAFGRIVPQLGDASLSALDDAGIS